MTDLHDRIARAIGLEVRAVEPVSGRGYTQAGRFRVRPAEGPTVFAKTAVDELTAGWLREEHLAYSHLRGPFIPPLLGWDDDDLPVLVIPDYGDAFSAPPWTSDRIAAVRESLRLLREAAAPPELPSVERFGEMRGRWDAIAAAPEEFLSLGLCSPRWLDANLDALRQAAGAAPIEGEQVLHLDVRSDNIGFVDGRAVFVDWNWSSRGNASFDLAGWLPSLAAEGGPAPDVLYDGEPGLIALVAGVWGSAAGAPPPPTAAPGVRAAQLAQLRVALPWACRALGLPPPDAG